MTVEVPHLLGQRVLLSVEFARQRAAEHAECFLGRVDLRLRVDTQQMGETRGVIEVAMRDDDEVQLHEINACRLHVLREDLGIVAGVEQDPLPAILDQRGIAPVLSHSRRLPERVVQDRDAISRSPGLSRRPYPLRSSTRARAATEQCRYDICPPRMTCGSDWSIASNEPASYGPPPHAFPRSPGARTRPTTPASASSVST